MNNKYNNLFNSEDKIQQLKEMLQSRNFPNSIKREQLKDFEIQNGHIVNRQTNQIVIPPNEKENKLQEIYDSNDGVGKSVKSLYHLLNSKYIGFTRKDVAQFLSGQTQYQMTQSAHHRVNKPVLSRFPADMFAIDLVSMDYISNKNSGYKYILTCTDVFSRKVWLARLKHKEAADVVDAMQDIFHRAGVTPNSILSDNGLEFKGAFSQFCKDNNIKQRFLRAYSPQGNPAERRNKEIRKLIRAFFLRRNSVKWIDILPEIENNLNTTYNSSIRAAPDGVWVPYKRELTTRDIPDSLARKNPRLFARNRLLKQAKSKIEQFQEQDNFQAGDVVRCSMASLFQNVRKKIKAKDTKTMPIIWSPELFVVARVIRPRKQMLERRRYILINSDQNFLRVKKHPKQFYSSELLLFQAADDETPIENDSNITMQRALELDGCQPNENDIKY